LFLKDKFVSCVSIAAACVMILKTSRNKYTLLLL